MQDVSAQEVIRYVSTGVAVVSVAVASVSLLNGYWWLLLGTLPWLIAGTAVASRLWARHFAYMDMRRMRAAYSSEQQPKASEESPYNNA